MFSKIKAVKVQKIIMEGAPSVIGTIKYNGLEDPTPLDTNNLPSAKPLFYNFSQYPAVNEVVYILVAPSTSYNRDKKISHYYLPPINVNGAPNHNAQPNELSVEEYEAGVETSLDSFTEKNSIRPLLPHSGDIMVEGRYGNSIRFGSTVSGSLNNWSHEGNVGDPITIIRNGQVKKNISLRGHILENINEDDSSIYLCSNQKIDNFQKAGVEIENYELSYKHML